MRFRLKGLILISLMCSELTQAHLYVADVDEAQWNVDISPLYCRLWQPVPAYGTGAFENRAGERQQFHLESKKKVYKEASAQLAIVSPEWKFDGVNRKIGTAPIVTGTKPLTLMESFPSELLAQLEAGYFPSISHPGWYQGHEVEVQLSSVNFTAAYQEYLQCLAGLYPANFEQLERTTVLFETDKTEIDSSYFERLKLIKGYLEVDPEITQIVIDGHTDNIGGDGYNWDLSKRRSEAVAQYLKEIGVPDDKLLIRYHGERFPVVKNKTAQTRQRNRRTTLRLSKGED